MTPVRLPLGVEVGEEQDVKKISKMENEKWKMENGFLGFIFPSSN